VPTLPDEEATCPVCSRLLVPRRDEFSLGCVECGGRWVDASRIAEALGPLPPPLAPAQRPALRARFPWSPAEPPANARRRCPRCRDDLARGPSSPAGPVWVDRCKAHGHGVWFDRDEWETYLAFVRAGGLSLPPPPHARPFPHLAPDGPLHSDPVWLHLLVQGL
jgi:Zn-finger nucleic acid-binding protein